jgi:hypothetical protein
VDRPRNGAAAVHRAEASAAFTPAKTPGSSVVSSAVSARPLRRCAVSCRARVATWKS